jgi:hypothetical protein
MAGDGQGGISVTVVEMPSGTQVAPGWLGGRFRLDERISVGDRISGAG